MAPARSEGRVGWEAATRVDLINGVTGIAPSAPATCAKSPGVGARSRDFAEGGSPCLRCEAKEAWEMRSQGSVGAVA